MARPIARTGEVSYDGFKFPSPLKLRVQCRPIYDDAERVVKYRTYSLHLEIVLVAEDFDSAAYGTSILAAGQPVDSTFQVLRKKLTEPGKRLIFKQQGLGTDLDVDYQKAVGFGPKPRLLLWEPMGSAQAARIVWECEVTVAECTRGILSSTFPLFLQFSYEQEFGISDEGLSQRTTVGVAEVNAKRSPDGGWANLLVDAHRKAIGVMFPLPAPYFRRAQTYSQSTDGRTLRFRLTDSEIASPNPYHPHVVRCEATQRVSGQQLKGIWNLGINARITVAPNTLRQVAWMAFLAIVKKRHAVWKTLNSGALIKSESSGRPPSISSATHFIARDFNYEEEIFGYGMSFGATFEIGCALADVFRASGAWQPVEGNWAAWQTSMALGPHNVRGSAQLTGSSTQKLVQVCVGLPQVQPSIYKVPPSGMPPVADVEKIFGPPPANGSWLRYVVRLSLLRNGAVIVSRRVGGSDAQFDVQAKWQDAENVQLQIDKDFPTVSPDDVEVQLRARSVYTMELHGMALRVHHPILDSDLVMVSTVDGNPPVEINGDDPTKTNLPAAVPWGACNTVYKAIWHRRYILIKPDAKIKLDQKPTGA